MRTIQTVMATTSLFCMSLNQLCMLILAAETVVTAQADLAILHAAFDSVLITLISFLGLLQAVHVANAALFDIPFHEEAARPSMVQLVRGSLVESLVRGSTPLVILGKGLGPHMSIHSPLRPRTQAIGNSWFQDFQLKGRNPCSGSNPLVILGKGLGSHMSSHNPLGPRIPGNPIKASKKPSNS
jgi:hypothetical protein